MKEFMSFLICSLIALLTGLTVQAANSNPTNLGFELGNFTNWVGYSWIYRTDIPSLTTPKTKGIIYGRHTIMSDTLAYDLNTGGKLKKIPKGSKYSARLGDAVTGGLEESLSYSMKIDSGNALLIWKFAVVLQDPLSGHLKNEEPRFRVSLLDQNGDTIPDCANYDVYVSDAKITGFQTYYPNGSTSNPIIWRDWTTVGANLLSYIGQTITIEFMAADCTHRSHYGYAYFIAESHPLYITVKYCTGDLSAILTAPEGFETYSWENEQGVIVSASKAYEVTNPTEGSVYSCNMTSATGCTVSLTSVIAKYQPNADFKYDLVDCNNLTNSMKFTNLHPATHGSLEYKWDFGDGTTSYEKSPTHTFNTSGLHPVSLVVSNPPSTCTDSMTKLVETFYPPLVGIRGDSTYCPGYSAGLKAHGAYRYEWSNGSKADSIEVGKDTTVWLIGYSSSGCYTDTIKFKVKQEPDWTFFTDGIPLFCVGESTVLSASGAISYRWNSGDTSKSITVNTAGIYTVSGTNPRGCEKSVSFNVVEDPLPQVDFNLSSPTVDTRHNQLTCTIAAQPGVIYNWNMGDGSTETGSTIQHTYTVSVTLKDYKITLTATNANGCVNTAFQMVDVVPFIPNVFTPNNDGVNERFLPEMDVQVFDRHGTLLYKGTDGWDGMYQGKLMDNDTYFYLIHYSDKYKQAQTRKGYVTLKK